MEREGGNEEVREGGRGSKGGRERMNEVTTGSERS